MRMPIFIALLPLIITACERNPIAVSHTAAPHPALVLSPGAAGRGLAPLPPRATSAEEDALIDEIVALYPATAAPGIRQSLLDPRTVSVWSSNNLRAQVLFNRLTAIRAARRDSIASADVARGPAGYAATVVALDRLPVQSADAVVLRRKSGVPHDVIELRSDQLTSGALAGAVHALIKSRDSEGPIPTKDEIFVIHGTTVPTAWSTSGFAQVVQAQLRQLATTAPRDINGFAHVRSISIQVAAHSFPTRNR